MQLLENKFITEYLDGARERLGQLKCYTTDQIDSKMAKLEEQVLARYRDPEMIVYNNVKEVEYQLTANKLVSMLRYSKAKPIITAFGTLFHRHERVTNVPGLFLDFLSDSRDVHKGKVFEHINDIDPTILNYHNILQLLFKRLANSFYGAYSQKNFHFFNTLLGPSVTSQGRQLVTTAIMAFEGILGNNIRYLDSDDLLTFIFNVLNEEFEEDFCIETAYEITPELVLDRYLDHCDFEVPVSIQQDLIRGFKELPLTQLQKLYYKNNFFAFVENEEMSEFITSELISSSFNNPNKPPEDLKGPLAEFFEYIRYFVGYPYPYKLKEERSDEIMRRVVLVCDTDSNFVYVYDWVKWVCEKLGMEPETLPRDLRAGIVSTITNILAAFVSEAFNIMLENSNVPEDQWERVDMKSELHLRRVMLTRNKKSYAGIILSKEGNVYNEPVFDIKGKLNCPCKTLLIVWEI